MLWPHRVLIFLGEWEEGANPWPQLITFKQYCFYSQHSDKNPNPRIRDNVLPVPQSCQTPALTENHEVASVTSKKGVNLERPMQTPSVAWVGGL